MGRKLTWTGASKGATGDVITTVEEETVGDKKTWVFT